MKTRTLSTLAILLYATTCFASLHRVSITVLDDESGRPLPGVEVHVNFDNSIPWRPMRTERVGETDAEGSFVTTATSSTGKIEIWTKPTEERYGKTENISSSLVDLLVSRTYRLRRRRPTQMNGHIVSIMHTFTNDFELATHYDYDILKANFLPPYGTGTVADVVFRVKEIGPKLSPLEIGGQKHRYEVTFPGKGNGMTLLPIDKISDFAGTSVDESRLASSYDVSSLKGNYVHFRIRSKFDDHGRLTDAHYGYFSCKDPVMRLFVDNPDGPQARPIRSFCRVDLECRVNPNPLENIIEEFRAPGDISQVYYEVGIDGVVRKL